MPQSEIADQHMALSLSEHESQITDQPMAARVNRISKCHNLRLQVNTRILGNDLDSKEKILHECSCFIEFIKQVWEKW